MIPGMSDNKFKLTPRDFFKLLKDKDQFSSSVLIQEDAGFHLGISPDLSETGRHVASVLNQHYDRWLESGWDRAGSAYKHKYFTIAVGGGNTVKAVYRALLGQHLFKIEWLQHVRFFFLEESSGENKWESARKSLLTNFLEPLCDNYIRRYGMLQLLEKMKLPTTLTQKQLLDHMASIMVHGFDLAATHKALKSGDKAAALSLVRKEAKRYQKELADKLGDEYAVHQVISGIGKDGGIGAFSAHDRELKSTKPGVVILKQDNGALRIALNRGILVNADQIYLIIAGSLKLRALGRFEMEDRGDFEQSVLETPIRMLRKTPELSEKVTIFADDRALHFDEDIYSYRSSGESFITKAETRDGLEDDGIHILLLHGFMGLYTYMNFLIRLPSAWSVSALHRGTAAKKMNNDEIFPHYADKLRHAILKNWKCGSPSPVGFHSMAGVISDHLLLGVVGNKGEIPAFESLGKRDQQLIDALRCAGMIHMATWAPSDVTHIEANINNLAAHRLDKDEPLYLGGPDTVYRQTSDKRLELEHFEEGAIKKSTRMLSILVKIPGTESLINLVNIIVRLLINKVDLHSRSETEKIPYALRLAGGRMIKKVSFYGLFKEVIAALHDPKEYQLRHMRALEAIIEYDIPYLSIIHEDDFMVSANRHREEHDYLLQRRLKKEGVDREKFLKTPVRFVLAERDEQDGQPSEDVLNPHLMLMSTDRDGEKLSRMVTAAITRFVNENVARAARGKRTRSLLSVRKWMKSAAAK